LLVSGSSIRAGAQGQARSVIQPGFNLDPSYDASRFCCTSHQFTQVLVISGKSIVPGDPPDQVFRRMSVLTKGQTSMCEVEAPMESLLVTYYIRLS
jgi:hypothetical protein